MELGGRIFGSTVLSHGVWYGKFAPRALELLNKDGVMSNENDSLDQLAAELATRFRNYQVTLFEAWSRWFRLILDRSYVRL